eukprot:c56471_g1_i1 orf=159-581(+)
MGEERPYSDGGRQRLQGEAFPPPLHENVSSKRELQTERNVVRSSRDLIEHLGIEALSDRLLGDQRVDRVRVGILGTNRGHQERPARGRDAEIPTAGLDDLPWRVSGSLEELKLMRDLQEARDKLVIDRNTLQHIVGTPGG